MQMLRTKMSDNHDERGHIGPEGFQIAATMGLPETRKIFLRIPLDADPGEWYPLSADLAGSIGSMLMVLGGGWTPNPKDDANPTVFEE